MWYETFYELMRVVQINPDTHHNQRWLCVGECVWVRVYLCVYLCVLRGEAKRLDSCQIMDIAVSLQ